MNTARAPLTVALARVRAQPGRALLVAAGVIAATAMLAGVLAANVTSQDQAVRRAVEELPPAEQTFRLDLFSASAVDTRRDDRVARRVLKSLAPTPVRRAVLFRTLRIDGELVRLAAVDRLAEAVRVEAGRLPRTCTPKRCEVLQIGTGGRGVLAEAGIAVVRVGTGTLRDDAVFGPLATAGENEHAPLLLAPSVQSLARLPSLASFFRIDSWVQRLDPSRLHVWGIPPLLARESRAAAALELTDPTFRLTGPDDALLAARARGRVASHRLALVGGEVSALLLGFALVAAMGLRRGQASERRRLVLRGARTWQVWLAAVVEVAAITAAGWLVGIGAGTAIAAVVAHAAGLPAGTVVSHSLGTPSAIAALAAVFVVATVAVVLAGIGGGAGGRVRVLDVVALAAAGIVVVAASRGAARPETIDSGSDRTLLLLLPGLACLVAAVAVARLVGPLMRGVERLSRRRSLALRLAALALARAPARTVTTVAFVVVTVGLALFATSYRATLVKGASDAAAFDVPLDYTVRPGSSLASPADPRTRRQLEQVARVYPVLRTNADLPGTGATITSATVLGVPLAALRTLRWRSDFAAQSPAKLAARLGRFGAARLRGATVPADATTLRLHTHVDGVPVQLTLVAEDADGAIRRLGLGTAVANAELRTRVPARIRRIVAVEIALTESEAASLEHSEAEGGRAAGAAGRLTLGPLLASTSAGGAHVVTGWQGWRARGGAGEGAKLRYTFTGGDALILRPHEATDEHAVPILVSKGIARALGSSRVVSLDFQDAHVLARVVAVAARFPTIHHDEGEFVVAEQSQLATALDADAPGTGAAQELWLAAPAGAATRIAERARPFEVDSRRSLQRRLEHDPLARATEATLAAAAIVALALAALGFWVAVTSELRDERGELFDLEAQGVAPATLRQHLRIRGAILLVLGALCGAVLGLALSVFVASLVRVSSTSEAPELPLRVEPAWELAAAAIGLLLVFAALAAELSARTAFRGDVPTRGAWSAE